MSPEDGPFHEAGFISTPIREMGLTIARSRLEPIWAEFEAELKRVGFRRLRPLPYLSTEWGVPFNTIAIAIPFYLAWPNLTALHAKKVGYVEGSSRPDILRYLRHEMGHVVNYAYRLYERKEWAELFGPISTPYTEQYRAVPFSPRYVHHLPGWYAQKHPDEDWAETFAVWMTPPFDWRLLYAERPVALRKLIYCDEIVKRVADEEPVVTAVDDLDEDVAGLSYPLEHYYRQWPAEQLHSSQFGGQLIDAYLREVFPDNGSSNSPSPAGHMREGGALIALLKREIMANVYRWTGHFPELVGALLQDLSERCRQLNLRYEASEEIYVTVRLTALVTALSMNYVQHGDYVPDGQKAKEPNA